MKQKAINGSYFINIGLTTFIYIYFILFYLFKVFSNSPYKSNAICNYIMTVGENIFNDEKNFSLILILILFIEIISIFSAIFYPKIVSIITYALLDCSFIPIAFSMVINIYFKSHYSFDTIALNLFISIILSSYLGATLYFSVKDKKLLK